MKKKFEAKPAAAPQAKRQTDSKKQFEFPMWIALVIFAVTTIVFFSDQLFGNAYFWEDFAEYVYPVQSFAARESAGFHIPFWNPYAFNGMPFFADLQTGFFYPLNRVLNLFVGSNGILSVGALQFMTILHFFIAQISMFFLMRKLKISSVGSIISAISYSFSFLLVLHVIHPMIVIHLSWFPLVLMFFIQGLREKNPRAAIISGLLMGMSTLAGHPQMTLFELFFLGMFLVWDFVAELKNKTFANSTVKYVLSGVLPFALAAGIFMVQYMPSKELADMSVRAEMSYEKSAEGSLHYSQLFTAVIPKLFGYSNGENNPTVPFYVKTTDTKGQPIETPYFYYWETGFYFGLAALILGLFGISIGYKSRTGAFFLAFIIFAVIYSLGDNGFLLPIFHNLPLFKAFRIPPRMMFGAALAFAYFAGIGFDKLSAKEKDKTDLKKFLALSGVPVLISLLAVAGVLGAMVSVPEEYATKIAPFATTALIISLSIYAIAFLTYKGILNRTIAGLAIATIAFVDANIACGDFNKSKVNFATEYELPAETIAAFKPSFPDNIFRVNMRMYSPSYMSMKRNQGMISGIMLVEGYNPLILKKIVPPLNTKDQIHQLYNVKYEIAIDTMRGAPYFAEKKDRLPRAWLAYNAVTVPEPKVERTMRGGNYNYAHTVVLEEQAPFAMNQVDSTTVANVKCLEYKNDEFKYQVNTPKSGMLCFSEIWYPAWKAYVDGAEVKMYRANSCLRAVPVPAGNHTVEMRYESDTFRTGSMITIFTLLASVLGLVFLKPDKKKEDEEQGD